jgi:hypothetical protein
MGSYLTPGEIKAEDVACNACEGSGWFVLFEDGTEAGVRACEQCNADRAKPRPSNHIPQNLAFRELRAWAKPRPGLGVPALVACLQRDGLPILEVDEPRGRVLVAYDRRSNA